MHSLVPVPGNDLPPGFESIATKRARLNASPVPAMVTQILWRYPERVSYVTLLACVFLLFHGLVHNHILD